MLVKILVAGPYRDYKANADGMRAKQLPVGAEVEFPDDYALYLIGARLVQQSMPVAEKEATPLAVEEPVPAAEEPAAEEVGPAVEEPVPAAEEPAAEEVGPAVKEPVPPPAKKKGSRQ